MTVYSKLDNFEFFSKHFNLLKMIDNRIADPTKIHWAKDKK
jgi:hypothetical protein